MKRLAFALLVLCAVVSFYYAGVWRYTYYRAPGRERSDAGRTRWLDKGFTVAVVWPPHSDVSLVEGITLAAEEIEAGGSPLAGRMRLRFLTEVADGGAVARTIALSPDVVAVIGHELPGNAIPASVTYEQHGILFLSPKATDSRLTDHNFHFVFRLTPDDRAIATALGRFARDRAWASVGVFHSRTDQSIATAGDFLEMDDGRRLTIPFVHSFFERPEWQTQDYRLMVAAARRKQFDAVMIAGQLPWAAKLLVDMSELGVSQPVLATDKLDSMQVWQLAQRAANNLYVASAVDPASTNPAYVAFRARFRRRFGTEPGYGASQGYESLMLFANACLRSRSADPLVLSTTLRTSRFDGLFGPFSFDETGGILGRHLSIKRLRDGAFRTVESIATN